MTKLSKCSIILALSLILMCGCSKAPEPAEPAEPAAVQEAVIPEKTYDKDALSKQLTDITDNRYGIWSVYVEALNTDFAVDVNNCQLRAASTIKLFNMVTFYSELNKGNIQTNDNLNRSLNKMITVSSNGDSNVIVTAIGNGDFAAGAEKVTAFAKSMGCTQTQEQHKLYDTTGPTSGKNTTSVKDCAVVLKKIYKEECVSPEYDRQMLELLKQQTRTSKIPKGVPNGIVVANKTGEHSKAELDVGIVFSPECDYILCVAVTDYGNHAIYSTFNEISKTVFNFFNPNYKQEETNNNSNDSGESVPPAASNPAPCPTPAPATPAPAPAPVPTPEPTPAPAPVEPPVAPPEPTPDASTTPPAGNELPME